MAENFEMQFMFSATDVLAFVCMYKFYTTILLEGLAGLRCSKTFPSSSDVETPSTYLWTLYLLDQACYSLTFVFDVGLSNS
ncbi:hypothetical protein KC19_9G115900 [Ceratodon purpureus]|uniref:Uncharacterized protein n=1 Tax=Ceratodon purpureus TaxID=3225 RepID=A0A8T0GDP0_CERPU|nr:hypothetical protein KC19_12G161700 [Ceratodon purpureus]KAG0555920.1 hypothetical protein KC19_11G013000 [Ceratodon purpureus]KAG0562073.1 hypothetical protein KC19_9G115900 [Ceratodon purpureus]